MYKKILNDVVEIMTTDYAGCEDKKGWGNPKKLEDDLRYLECNGMLTPESFMEIVQDYLLDFKDPHMSFKAIKRDVNEEYDIGFSVRRYQEKLYVTSVGKENRLSPGYAITSLDNLEISELVSRHQRELMETMAEREDWGKILLKYKVAEVTDRKGKQFLVPLKKYNKIPYSPKHTVTKVNDNTLLLTMTDFFSLDTIGILLNNYKEEIENTENLIIDTRINYGGTDAAFDELVPYLFPSGNTKVDFSAYDMKFNCSKRNTVLQTEFMSKEITKIESLEIRQRVNKIIEAWKDNEGKGFVAFDSFPNQVDIEGMEKPKNIIVLSDVYCGSAGDIFVFLCKQSPKVTVLGRATKGLNDYSNLVRVTWNNQFEFYYPTSRLDQIDNRGNAFEPGIKPDVYIPWSPKHIEKDVDMEEALRILHLHKQP